MEVQKQPPDQVVVVIEQAKAPATALRRLNFPKPKARFAETNYPIPPKSEELEPLNPYEDSSSDDDDEWFDDVDKEDQEDGEYLAKARKRWKINRRALIEWVLFCAIMTALICSLTLDSLKNEVKWGLKIWKWCLMVMVLFCGRLVSGWVVGFLVFIIERNFMLREKVLYFVYGLRKSFQNCVWLGLVLLAWMIMFPNFHKHNKMLKKVFRALVAVLIAATIWLLKIVLVKVLASSFHVATFFDRMKESVFHHYVLEALSGPPLEEGEQERPRRKVLVTTQSLPAKLRDGKTKTLNEAKSSSRKIDMNKLRRLSRRASAWSVKRLVSFVRSSGLSTISRTVDDFGDAESEINSEWEARSSAQRIFKNVAKPHAKSVPVPSLSLSLSLSLQFNFSTHYYYYYFPLTFSSLSLSSI